MNLIRTDVREAGKLDELRVIEIGLRAASFEHIEMSRWAYRTWFMSPRWWWDDDSGSFIAETRHLEAGRLDQHYWQSAIDVQDAEARQKGWLP
jgi:hypothetical protein